MSRYQDKKVVILGGTSGMGLATAKMLLDGGARVLVTGRSQAGLGSAREALGENAIVVSSDARSLTDIDALAAQVKDQMPARRRASPSPDVSAHWLRHAHASHALDRGAPIHLVQATLGHASVATTGDTYMHDQVTAADDIWRSNGLTRFARKPVKDGLDRLKCRRPG